ncbi:MAG: 1-acyl-sn-glycerol-3-phosphate acyltransferase [Lentimicrobiaceae bacterium]|nr:1-acyl-sn-glycerol-3-phosphate acyltransferase [Lentimicrobiaceae bacterium]
MMRLLAKLILALAGWKIKAHYSDEMRRSVIIQAPHTSNWDFFIGKLGFVSKGIPVRFLIKKEAFRFPLGPLVRALGGIPVDRSHSSNLVPQIAAMYKEHQKLMIVITPEGTRKLNRNWKKGFYYIASMAQVPIVLGYLDYGKKEGGLGPVFHPTGDYEADLRRIEDFYRDKTARHPEKFNLSQQRDDPEAVGR